MTSNESESYDDDLSETTLAELKRLVEESRETRKDPQPFCGNAYDDSLPWPPSPAPADDYQAICGNGGLRCVDLGGGLTGVTIARRPGPKHRADVYTPQALTEKLEGGTGRRSALKTSEDRRGTDGSSR